MNDKVNLHIDQVVQQILEDPKQADVLLRFLNDRDDATLIADFQDNNRVLVGADHNWQ